MLPKPVAYLVLQYLIKNDNYYQKYVTNDFYKQFLINKYDLTDVDQGLTTLNRVYLTLKVLNRLKLYPTIKSFNYIINLYLDKHTLHNTYGINRLISITQYFGLGYNAIPQNLVYPTFINSKNYNKIYQQLLSLIQKPTDYVTIDGIKTINFDIDCLLYESSFS